MLPGWLRLRIEACNRAGLWRRSVIDRRDGHHTLGDATRRKQGTRWERCWPNVFCPCKHRRARTVLRTHAAVTTTSATPGGTGGASMASPRATYPTPPTRALRPARRRLWATEYRHVRRTPGARAPRLALAHPCRPGIGFDISARFDSARRHRNSKFKTCTPRNPRSLRLAAVAGVRPRGWSAALPRLTPLEGGRWRAVQMPEQCPEWFRNIPGRG